MSSFTATNTTLAGLGLSFDSITISNPFSSGEENFNSLFSSEAHAEERGDLAVLRASECEWDEPEAYAGFNHFEPYRGAEENDFKSWPASPEVMNKNTEASPELQAVSVPATPNDRGYETDTECSAVKRRGARKLSHNERVRRLLERIQRIPEEPEQGDTTAPAQAAASDSDSEPESDASLFDSLDSDDSDVDHYFYDSDGNVDVAALFNPPTGAVHYTACPGSTRAHFVDTEASDSDSDVERRAAGSDSDSGVWYGSDDSDEDHYFYDSDGNVDVEALFNPPTGKVHYTWTRSERTWDAESEDVSQFESQEHDNDAAPAPVGLGITVNSLPLSIPSPRATAEYDDGFETVDLSDDAPATAHAAPTLRAHLAEGSPSPMVLASPMPFAAFRRFDEVLFLGAESE